MRKSLSLLCLILLLTGCGVFKKEPQSPAPPVQTETPPPAAQPTDDRPVILAFGDSLTAGQGVPREENYPSRLQAELDARGYSYRVANAGISGDTTAGGLARIDRWLTQTTPEVVILELGANDGLRGLSVFAMKENLAQIIQKAKAAGAVVVLAGMQMPPNYGPEYTGPFQQAFVDLAAEHDVAFIPFFLDGVAGEPGLNQDDAIHPTGEGYKIVVDNILPVLEQVLKQ